MQPVRENGIGLFNTSKVCVARLSPAAQAKWTDKLGIVMEVRVLAMLRRNAEQDSEDSRRERYLVPEWEVPVVEVVTATRHED